jgi:hypothetical protein
MMLFVSSAQIDAFNGYICATEEKVTCHCTKMSTDQISIDCTALKPTVHLPKFKVDIYVNTVFMILHGKFEGLNIKKLLKTWYNLEFLNVKETSITCKNAEYGIKKTDILCFQDEKPNTSPTFTLYDQTTITYNLTSTVNNTYSMGTVVPNMLDNFRTGLIVSGTISGVLFIILGIICALVVSMYIRKRRRESTYATRGPIYSGLSINMAGFDENETDL